MAIDHLRRSEPNPPIELGGHACRANLLVVAVPDTIAVLAPLFVILACPQSPERGFWVEFGVASGFIGLAMLCLRSALTARSPKLSGPVGQDNMLQFHRQTGPVAFGFVGAHPVVLRLANSGYWDFLAPRVNFLRAISLIFVVVALPALIVSVHAEKARRTSRPRPRCGPAVR